MLENKILMNLLKEIQLKWKKVKILYNRINKISKINKIEILIKNKLNKIQ